MKLIWRNIFLQVLIAIALGVLIGSCFPNIGKEANIASLIFVKLIKMIIVPLVFVAVILGICQQHGDKNFGLLAFKTLAYFEIIAILAIGISFAVTFWLQPGSGFNTTTSFHADVSQVVSNVSHAHTGLKEFLLNIVPDNFVGTLTEHNLLAVMCLAIIVAFALNGIKRKGIILDNLHALNELFFSLITMISRLAPLAAFGAIANEVATAGLGALVPLLYLIFTTLVAMLILCGTLFAVAFLYGFNPFKLMYHIKEELMIAYGTSSSESVFPQLMQKLESFGCSKKIVSFVLPAGYSFNLAGSAVYVGTAVIFLQQAYHVPLSWQDIALLFGIIMLTSKGAAGVAGAGFVTLAATLAAIPNEMIPMAGLALLLGIDRFMSDARTISNVVCNSLVTVMISRSEQSESIEPTIFMNIPLESINQETSVENTP
jgi:aerobic C4-dicarboxylate transport protein